MTIRDLLASQEIVFISLHEVLSRLTELHGESYTEVAQFLIRALRQIANEEGALVWYEMTKTRPMTPLREEDLPTAWRCLEQACHEGEPPVRPQWNENDWDELENFDALYPDTLPRQYFDTIGFDRNNLVQFLLSHGLTIRASESITTADPTPENCTANRARVAESSTSAQLLACYEKNAHLEQQLSSLNTKLQVFEDMKKELSRVQKKLAEIEPLVVDSRMRKTYLTIIGVIAGKHYEIDIHNDRKDGIGKLISDLELAQCPLNEKTVRACLKDAAVVIKEKSKKTR